MIEMIIPFLIVIIAAFYNTFKLRRNNKSLENSNLVLQGDNERLEMALKSMKEDLEHHKSYLNGNVEILKYAKTKKTKQLIGDLLSEFDSLDSDTEISKANVCTLKVYYIDRIRDALREDRIKG